MNDKPIRVALAGQALIERPVDLSVPAAARLSEELRGADLAATNFEVTMDAPGAWPLKAKTMHVATPEALASLRTLGFNALALANNHAFDLGPPGVIATRDAARKHGFATAGSGESADAAAQPAVVEANGTRLAICSFDLGPQAEIVYAGAGRAGINPLRIRKELVLPPADAARLAAIARECGYTQKMKRRIEVGYSEAASADALDFFGVQIRSGSKVAERRYPDSADLNRATAAIKAARARANIAIVSCHHHHWDADWSAAPQWLTGLGADLVDAGADVVFFHGAPVLQGMSLHRGRPIFHGMGNFIFHTARAPRYDDHGIDVWRSIVAVCDLKDGIVGSIRILPIRVGLPLDKSGGSLWRAPEILDGEEAQKTIDGFVSRSTLDGCRMTHAGGLLTIDNAN